MSRRILGCVVALCVSASSTAWAQAEAGEPAPLAPPEVTDEPAEPTEGGDGEGTSGEAAEPPAEPPADPTPPPEPQPEPAPEPSYDPGEEQPPTPQATPADDSAGKSAPPPELTLGLGIDGGVFGRLEGQTEGYASGSRGDIAYGGGLWFAPNRLFTIGLSYQRLGLGSEETAPHQAYSVSVQRATDVGWLTGRVYPLRSDTAGLFIQGMFGLSWQALNANGTTLSSGTPSVAPATGFRCSARGAARLAIGVGVGAEVEVERNLAFIARGELQAHQLSNDPIDLDGCAEGSGTATVLGAQIGLLYRFDLGG